MQDLKAKFDDLQSNLKANLTKIDFESKQNEVTKLNELSQKPGFWDDSQKASQTMQKLSNLSAEVEVWQSLKKDVEELGELINLNDEDLRGEVEKQIAQSQQTLDELLVSQRFSGPYDDHNAVLSIYAGAGGTDAQDWTQMLLRMYLRWAEKNDIKTKVIDESPGEEAGLKSVQVEFNGRDVFGKLRSEHGVHRLVRLSPFNADAKRQTSFAKVEILPKIDAPEELPIDEKDLKIDVFRAGGHGGQSVNTTDSAVRITHIPSGVVVSIQNERSQLQNKETAMTILRSKLAQLQIEQHLENLSEIKGPNQSAEWGNQIRSYVLHPYNMVKDLRTNHETSNASDVLDGELNPFINAYLSN